jgi:signal transduction histidine kinase
VSYGIINEHGGSIQMESEEGEGATFTVTLPLPDN